MAQKSINLNYSLVLEGIFILKHASQFLERYHSAVGCALNTEDFLSLQMPLKFLTYFSILFTNYLTDVWATLYVAIVI
jgi:hypothetical protein